jgi:signal transduction histidine kinase
MRLGLKFALMLASCVLISVIVTTGALSSYFTSDQEGYLSDFQSHLALFAQHELGRQMDLLYVEVGNWLMAEDPQPLGEILPGAGDIGIWRGGQLVRSYGSAETLEGAPPAGNSRWALVASSSPDRVRWIGRYQDQAVSVLLRSAWLRETFEASNGAITRLLGPKGEILVGESNTDGGLFRQPEALVPKLLAHPTGTSFTGRYLAGDGASHLGTSLLFDTEPRMLIFVSTPWSSIQAVITRTYRQATWIVAVCLILAIGIGILFSSTLTSPLKALDRQTGEVAQGNLQISLARETRRGDEVGRLARSFNRMIEELLKLRQEVQRKERLAALGQFSAGIAHEIKNPLGGILGQTQLAKRHLKKEQPDTPAALRALDLVEEETRRANRIVTQLMKFARKERTPKERLNIGERVRHSLEVLKPQIEEAKVTLELRLPEQAIVCLADGEPLHEVILNLIQNALHAMEDSEVKRLTVSLSETQGFASLRIADTGSGMTAEVRQHLFEPFFTTKSIGRGTGLGLATCHGIILSHRGQIEVESTVGEGSTFIVRLPILAEESQHAA